MSEAGELVYDLSLAALTGWALNWLIVERPRRRDQHVMYEALGPRVQGLGGVGRAIASGLAGAIGFSISKPDVGPTSEEWQRICAELSFDTPLLGFVVPAQGEELRLGTVGQFVLAELDRAERLGSLIQQSAPYFHADLLALIHREQISPLRRMARFGNARARPLKDMASTFVDYDERGRAISTYYEKHIQPYTSNRLPDD
jgi:hypothetical protein